eukprot:augustus_masked-scaffold_2-processed-gene-22.47-mRNA-1 protein AED:0.07 eAED:0.07 QI:0/-1/0/1/-1/1/1/0/579
MDLDDSVFKGRHFLAKALKAAGVEYVFGIVGYPVIELGFAIQKEGIKYIGMRNEQAASYAAAAYGYLTGKPGVCLVVPGPGVIHALAGMANGSVNGWPLLVIGGSSELELDGLGAFQESLPPQGGAQMQLSYVQNVTKYAAKIVHTERIPFYVEQALRYATHGRPGAVYLEIAGDSLRNPVDTEKINLDNLEAVVSQHPVRLTQAPRSEILRSLNLLQKAKTPLVIFGKGAAYSGAGNECRKFIEATGIPFLPSPMGKGVVSDTHPLCSASARSFVLRNADVILLVGARLNWILHYGQAPRYRKDAKFIHVELLPEEVDSATKSAIGLVGHAKAIMGQINAELGRKNEYDVQVNPEWVQQVQQVKDSSMKIFKELEEDRTAPMNYYCALGIVNKYIPEDAVIVNEGSDTMDIGRTVLLNHFPRKRIDAATWGTMGVGAGQAIASALVNPLPGCVFVAGDSAFGFSAMEFEVVTRYQLPVVVVIINNNGIGPFNVDEYDENESRFNHPAKSLAPQTRYEKIAEAFGAVGKFVSTADDLEVAVKEALSFRPFKPTIINCMISSTTTRGKPAIQPWAKGSNL